MNEAEYPCLWRKLRECVQTVFKLSHIMPVEIFASHIEYVNEHLYVFEDVFSLTLEELFHE